MADDDSDGRCKARKCEGEEILSTDSDGSEAMQSGSKRVLMQESLIGELPMPIPNVVHHALAQI